MNNHPNLWLSTRNRLGGRRFLIGIFIGRFHGNLGFKPGRLVHQFWMDPPDSDV